MNSLPKDTEITSFQKMRSLHFSGLKKVLLEILDMLFKSHFMLRFCDYYLRGVGVGDFLFEATVVTEFTVTAIPMLDCMLLARDDS